MSDYPYMNQHTNNLNFIYLVNLAESYNVTLYGLLLIIIAPVFLNSANKIDMLTNAYLAYYAGFLARPFGGWIIGKLADQYGGLFALKISLYFITIPSLVLCFLPSYNDLGFISSTLLYLSIILHGFGVATTYTSTVLISELSKLPGKYTGFLYSIGFIGSLLAILVYIFFSFITKNYAFRCTYFLGAMLGFLSLLYPINANKIPPQIQTNSTSILISKYINNIALAAGIATSILIPFVAGVIYINGILEIYNIANNTQILVNEVASLLTWIILLAICGRLSDRFDAKKIMICSLLCLIVLTMPLFLLFQYQLTIVSALIINLTYSSLGALYTSGCITFLPTLFPKTIRSTCVNLSHSIGFILIAAPIPIILNLIFQITEHQIFISLFLVTLFSISFLCLFSIKINNDVFINKLIKT